ncbi:MAG TPA: type II toxin-antitoxin system VapC family toxin [Solirubrobacterales bacterium]|nr:type II toxin-antitoxin system VapC family toxin [Solirubrobacterales bacterium]
MAGRLKLLLDTHVMLWAISDPGRLSVQARNSIASEENEVFVSVVSPWEIAIKKSRNRIEIPDDLDRGLESSGFKLLPVLLRHTKAIESMPHHHRDPFDRMLVAQAIVDGMILVTADRKLTHYTAALMPAI